LLGILVNLDATVRDFRGRETGKLLRALQISVFPHGKNFFHWGRLGLWIYTGEWAVWIC
jgi:hypothetical protein